MDFAAHMRALMAERGLGVRALARAVPCDPALVSRLASGKAAPSRPMAARIDEVLGGDGTLAALTSPARSVVTAAAVSAEDDEIAALDLARQASASEVGTATVERLELAVDDLATAHRRRAAR